MLSKPVKPADLATAVALAVRRFGQFEDCRREAADLRRALEERKTIERAKGAVMRRSGVDEAEAYRRLRKLSSNRNLKLVEVAQTVLAAEAMFEQLEQVESPGASRVVPAHGRRDEVPGHSGPRYGRGLHVRAEAGAADAVERPIRPAGV